MESSPLHMWVQYWAREAVEKAFRWQWMQWKIGSELESCHPARTTDGLTAWLTDWQTSKLINMLTRPWRKLIKKKLEVPQLDTKKGEDRAIGDDNSIHSMLTLLKVSSTTFFLFLKCPIKNCLAKNRQYFKIIKSLTKMF